MSRVPSIQGNRGTQWIPEGSAMLSLDLSEHEVLVPVPSSGFIRVRPEMPESPSGCDECSLFLLRVVEGHRYKLRVEGDTLYANGAIAAMRLRSGGRLGTVARLTGSHKRIGVSLSAASLLESGTLDRLLSLGVDLDVLVYGESGTLGKFPAARVAALGRRLRGLDVRSGSEVDACDLAAGGAVTRLEYLATNGPLVMDRRRGKCLGSLGLKSLSVAGFQQIPLALLADVPSLESLAAPEGMLVLGYRRWERPALQRINRSRLATAIVAFRKMSREEIRRSLAVFRRLPRLGKIEIVDEWDWLGDSEVEALNGISRLRSLRRRYSQLTATNRVQAARLLRLRALRSISVVGSAVSEDIASAICRHPRLSDVSLFNVHAEELQRVLRCLAPSAPLVRLAIAGPKGSLHLGAEEVDKISRLQGLREIALRNVATGLGVERLIRLSQLRRLVVDARTLASVASSVGAGGTAVNTVRVIGAADDGAVSALATLTSLRKLEVDELRLSSSGLQKLNAMRGLRDLSVGIWDLRACGKVAVKLRDLRTLQVLRVKKGGRGWFDIRGCHRLRYARLGDGSDISDVRMAMSSGSLRVLQVGHMRDQCGDALDVRGQFEPGGVESVILQGPKCLSKIATWLVRLPHLRALCVAESRDWSTIRKLRRQFPRASLPRRP